MEKRLGAVRRVPVGVGTEVLVGFCWDGDSLGGESSVDYTTT